MDRRNFLKYGAFGAAAALAPAASQAATVEFQLAIQPFDVELIDGSTVFMLLYQGGAPGFSTPRPMLRATQGDTVRITIVNNAATPHGFSIPGVTQSIPSIPPGGSATLTFTAPRGGTYMYVDPVNAPANRLLGLHGAFIVAPRNGRTAAGAQTPYSTLNPALTALFDAFGTARFPGRKWNPSEPGREKIWLFSSIDPSLNAAAANGETINVSAIYSSFTPRYFTINGLSGFDLEHEETVVPRGYVGQPTLIRTLNAGLCTHAPHIHGNHVFELGSTNASGAVTPFSNIYERDTWTLAPMDRKDVLLPFEKPKHIPPAAWPPRQEPFPMRYVMHCHTEMSQTAAGGNYPQGMVTHWELLGPLQAF